MDNSGTRQDVQAAMATIDEYVKTDVGAAAECYDAVWSKMDEKDRGRYFDLIYGALTDETVEKMIAVANKGVETAISMLGKGYYFKKLHKNGVASMEDAAHWAEAGVAKRHPSAMCRLAVLLRNGEGVDRDFNRSFVLEYEALEADAAWAGTVLFGMASLYISPRNEAQKAAGLLLLAAEIGWLRAICELGRMYIEGSGVDRDLSKAKGFLSFVISMMGDKNTDVKRKANELLKKIPESFEAAQWKPSGKLGDIPSFVKDDYEKAKAGVLFAEDNDM